MAPVATVEHQKIQKNWGGSMPYGPPNYCMVVIMCSPPPPPKTKT